MVKMGRRGEEREEKGWDWIGEEKSSCKVFVGRDWGSWGRGSEGGEGDEIGPGTLR